MSTKEALEALIGGQAFEFRSKIEDELAARSLEAIQTKRFEVGASMFGDEFVEEEFEDIEEEVEELDELSSDTLRNYERKATLYNFKRKGDPEKRKKRSDMIKLAGYKNTRNKL